MDPDIYLYVEQARAHELRAAADHHRLTRPAPRMWEIRLGWALIETGLRLVHRRTVDY
ncbi:hypothetical protein SAMN05444920_103698 [Nonomuraea solani]|uniref:Uncharacterized protein n=1 Tax=Nonomuraea solani TaxID=1144553 RepID=A0A1H6BXD0_9ACTN|nr:hypothetical protein [Nonomuraea solani]SEG64836.1 hypothetical protein SAMN05444920_103698 [Nonomuraea solani]